MTPLDARRAVAAAWLDKARGDLTAAVRCAEAADVAGWVIGFHCQQAVEKALKGLLVLLDVAPPRIHDLVRLGEVIVQSGGQCPIEETLLEALLVFGVEDRYPMLSAPDAPRADAVALIAPARIAVAALEESLR